MTMGDSQVVLHRFVPDDLLEIIDYLAARSPAAADRFAEAVPRTLDDVARFPGAGSLREFEDPRLAGIRSWRVRGFRRYLIYYRPIDGGIMVLAVLHGARDLPKALGGRA
jgi:toxin ParE1/3/4